MWCHQLCLLPLCPSTVPPAAPGAPAALLLWPHSFSSMFTHSKRKDFSLPSRFLFSDFSLSYWALSLDVLCNFVLMHLSNNASKRFALNSLVSTARRVVAHPGAFLPLLHGVEPNPGSRSRKAVRKWHPGPGLEPNISAQSLALSASSRKSPKSHPTSCSSCLSLVRNPKRCPQHWDAPYWELFSPFALWQGAHVSTQIISSFLCPTAVPSH